MKARPGTSTRLTLFHGKTAVAPDRFFIERLGIMFRQDLVRDLATGFGSTIDAQACPNNNLLPAVEAKAIFDTFASR